MSYHQESTTHSKERGDGLIGSWTNDEDFRVLVENSIDIIATQSPTGVYLYVSPACVSLLGYAAEEMIGHASCEFLHPDEVEAIEKWQQELLRSPATKTITHRIRRQDGSYLWVETSGRTIGHSDPNKALAIQTASRDISERKTFQEATQQHIKRLELLHEIDRDIVEAEQPQMVAQSIISRLQKLIEFSSATVTRFANEHSPSILLAAIAPTSDYQLQEDAAVQSQLQKNKVYLVDDLRTVSRPSSNEHALIMAGVRSYVHIPLMVNGKLLGAISFFTRVSNAIERQAIDVASEVASHFAIAIANSRALEVEQCINQGLVALHEENLQLTGSFEVEKALETILHDAILLVHANGAQIFLYDEETGSFDTIKYVSKQLQVPVIDELLEQVKHTVVSSGELMTMPDVRDYVTDESCFLAGAIIGLPLYVAGKVNGVMVLNFVTSHQFEDHEIRLMELLADQAAFAMHNAQLHRQLGHQVEDLEQRVQKHTADLQESEAKYSALIEFASDPIVITNATGFITLANKSAEETFGYRPQELIGQPLEILLPERLRDIHVAHRTHYAAEPVQRAMGANLNLKARHKDGSEIPVKIGLSPIKTRNETLIMAYITDITLEKQLEERLRLALAKERELNELKSRFVSMASHEFRTPLASIIATTETLLSYRQRLTEQQITERLRKIQDRVDYLSSIMEDVLLLAQLEARRAEFNPKNVDLDAICRSILDEFQHNTVISHPLRYAYDNRLNGAVLDEKLMYQIITNLLSNAIKYSPAGKPVGLRLDYVDNMLVLQVQDEGIGITEADSQHLFEPFHRGTNVGTISGTGLGLTIIKEAIELHSGFVTVDSDVGNGTIFTVTIPVGIALKPSQPLSRL